MIEFRSETRGHDFSHVFLEIFIWKPYSKYQPIESLFHDQYNAILIDIVRPQNSSKFCCKDKTREKPLQRLGRARALSVKAVRVARWA